MSNIAAILITLALFSGFVVVLYWRAILPTVFNSQTLFLERLRNEMFTKGLSKELALGSKHFTIVDAYCRAAIQMMESRTYAAPVASERLTENKKKELISMLSELEEESPELFNYFDKVLDSVALIHILQRPMYLVPLPLVLFGIFIVRSRGKWLEEKELECAARQLAFC